MKQNTEDRKQESAPVGINEVTSLNIEDLDVQELEHRLELVAAAPDPGCWILGKF